MADEPAELKDPTELKGEGYEIFIAALAVLSIVNLVLLYAVQDEALDSVIYVMNIILTAIFLVDFTYRFATAQRRSRYFFREFGWADLLSCIPFASFKVLRLFRLVKVYRLLQEKGAKQIGRTLIKDRAGSALIILVLIAILMLEFGSLWMLRLEAGFPDANITTASDSMWYVIVTMATVGYGDQFPISNPGRILGTVIILIGVGIFGTLTGYLANAFLSPATKKQSAEPDDLDKRLAALKDLASKQAEAIAELEAIVTKGK
ncbi:MAG: ion transporter [Actinomycetota bacterium]|nr:ion transporter [Actinomycetota bacterium]